MSCWLGRALRMRRKQKSCTEKELAACLLRHGFTAPDLAKRIRDIEACRPWPFTDGERAPFLHAAAKCLDEGNEQEAFRQLAKAMAADILEERTPGMDYDLGDDD